MRLLKPSRASLNSKDSNLRRRDAKLEARRRAKPYTAGGVPEEAEAKAKRQSREATAIETGNGSRQIGNECILPL
jgi:hypothetical protein